MDVEIKSQPTRQNRRRPAKKRSRSSIGPASAKKKKTAQTVRERQPFSKNVPFAIKKWINWRNTYNDSITMQNLAVTTQTYRLNDLYDPYVTGAGNTRPLGFAALCPDLYDRYEVSSGWIHITVSQLVGANAIALKPVYVITVISRVIAPAYASVREALSQPGATFKILGGQKDIQNQQYKDSVSILKKFTVRNHLDEDDMIWVSTGASPGVGETLYLHLCLVTTDESAQVDNVSAAYNLLGIIGQTAKMGRKVADIIPIN